MVQGIEATNHWLDHIISCRNSSFDSSRPGKRSIPPARHHIIPDLALPIDSHKAETHGISLHVTFI